MTAQIIFMSLIGYVELCVILEHFCMSTTKLQSYLEFVWIVFYLRAKSSPNSSLLIRIKYEKNGDNNWWNLDK